MEQTIERQIHQRTWGRIHRLHVQVVGERVVVHGCASSYYLKQLALESVLDVLGPANVGQVDLNIQVSTRRAAVPVDSETMAPAGE